MEEVNQKMGIKKARIGITLYVQEETAEEFRRLCSREHRSMAAQIEFLIDRHINSQEKLSEFLDIMKAHLPKCRHSLP